MHGMSHRHSPTPVQQHALEWARMRESDVSAVTVQRSETCFGYGLFAARDIKGAVALDS